MKQIVTNEFTILKSWNILFLFFNYHCHIQDDRGQESQVKYGCCSLKHDNDDLDEDDRDDGNDMMCNIVIHSGMDIIILLFNTSSFLYYMHHYPARKHIL